MSQPDTVEVHFPAHTRHIRLARLTASGFASELDLSVDDIEELRLAVDEACALLVQQSPDPASRLRLVYRVEDGAVQIEGRCEGSGPDALALDPVTKAVLDTTTDSYEVLNEADGTAVFRIVKRPTPKG